MMASLLRLLGLFVLIVVGMDVAAARDLSGRVVDAKTGVAIPGATLTVDGRAITTDDAGEFQIVGLGEVLQVRAPGYARLEIETGTISGDTADIGLTSFAPKALYLSFWGIGYGPLRNGALDLIRDTPMNALVIDLKGDRGMIPYRSEVPLATELGALKTITIKDLPGLLQSLRDEGIYTIARIVVFKDDLLAGARPDLALKTIDGSVYLDREGLRWVDPTSNEVHDYNVALAEEAAKAGFDEIQFDYVRFPDTRRVQYASPNTEEMRTKAINDFLDAARERLTPYNVFLAADIFGYVCWNLDDTKIGQRLEDFLSRVDYLSPMLYPSGFQHGIPGYRNPVANSYEIVKRTLDNVVERTQVSPLRLRPWLQAFKDYAFDGRRFDADEVREQVRAAEDFGSSGWMLWNPRNVYPDPGLEPETTAAADSDTSAPQ